MLHHNEGLSLMMDLVILLVVLCLYQCELLVYEDGQCLISELEPFGEGKLVSHEPVVEAS